MGLVAKHVRLQDAQLDMLQELYKRYPGAVDRGTLKVIAENADMPVLQWIDSLKPRVLFLHKFTEIKTDIFYGASQRDRVEVVRWLLELFPHEQWELTVAAQEGCLDIIKLVLLQSRVARWTIGYSFHQAIKAGHLDVAQYLLKETIPVEKPGWLGVPSHQYSQANYGHFHVWMPMKPRSAAASTC